jgi:hypothetical protein
MDRFPQAFRRLGLRAFAMSRSGSGRIIRHKHSKHFTIVPNAIFEHPNLSVGAKSLLCYLLSRPPNWQASQGHLERALKIGRKRLRQFRDELVEAGYIECDVAQGRDAQNKFTTLNYVVRDIPLVSVNQKPQRTAPLHKRSDGNNKKEEIKTDLNKSLPKPLSVGLEPSGLSQQEVYTRAGEAAILAGSCAVYVGSEPYRAWERFRGPDGMPGFKDRVQKGDRVYEVVWMPSLYPPRHNRAEDGRG